MSERMAATLGHIEQPRVVLVGSIGRAAFLGDADFSSSLRDGQDRDVDVIDIQGLWQRKYEFSDAAPIDGLMTRRLRPLADEAEVWGLFTPSITEEPALRIPQQSLGLEKVSLPFSYAQGRSITTPGSCTQLMLHKLMSAEMGPNLKHRRQVERIASDKHDATQCNCDELRESLDQYHAIVRQELREGVGAKMYFWGRWALKATAPQAFKKLQEGAVGKAVRRVRNTPETVVTPPSIHELT